MKNFKMSRTLMSKGIVLLSLIAFLLPVSCVKNTEVIIPDTGEDDEADYSNLAAYFSGMESTLFVLPEFAESVLISLGADQTNGEKYVMAHPNYDGDWMTVSFGVVPVNSQEKLIELAITTRQQTDEILAAGVTASAKPADSQTYFNSQCVYVDEKYGTCHVIGNRSTVTYKYPRNKCQKGGTGKCTEYLSPGWSETRTFKNRDCSGSFTKKETNEWVCKK